MFEDIALGVYQPGQTLLHRLQARTKLLALGWMIGCVTVANQRQWHFVPYAVLVLYVCVGVGLAGMTLRYLWQRLRLLLLAAGVGAVSTLLLGEGDPIYTLGPMSFSYSRVDQLIQVMLVLFGAALLLSLLPVPPFRAMQHGRLIKPIRNLLLVGLLSLFALHWFVADRPPTATLLVGPLVLTDNGVWPLISVFVVFLALYILALLVTMTTTPAALIEGLTRLLAPARSLGLPIDAFALMALLALRFIPTLSEELNQLFKAQTSRGADFTHGSLRERLQSLTMLFVPLVQGALRRAAELATALEARGYTVAGQPTPLHETSLRAIDYMVLSIVMFGMLGSLLF